MARWTDVVQVQTVTGDPVTVGATTVTPQSQAISVRWPQGGLMWHRPVAALVERDGQTTRLPIVDVTRLVQLGLLGMWLILWLAMAQAARRRKGARNE